MFETRCMLTPTLAAMKSPQLQADYHRVWQGLKKNFDPQKI
jgi:homogentisate 1,2-dioxygenase